ncbi:hypothetical protein QE152_g16943 [Popillia japonica]|uniref:Uncharacterized protein n=1 Tax=Popillia japonica TaxID=7064 RepID=A0AAW1L2Y9_POPJA
MENKLNKTINEQDGNYNDQATETGISTDEKHDRESRVGYNWDVVLDPSIRRSSLSRTPPRGLESPLEVDDSGQQFPQMTAQEKAEQSRETIALGMTPRARANSFPKGGTDEGLP